MHVRRTIKQRSLDSAISAVVAKTGLASADRSHQIPFECIDSIHFSWIGMCCVNRAVKCISLKHETARQGKETHAIFNDKILKIRFSSIWYANIRTERLLMDDLAISAKTQL